MRFWTTLLVASLALSGLSAGELANELDGAGRLLTLNSGNYSDFFEDGDPDDEHTVLALGVRSEESLSYRVVPGSENVTLGTVASLVHDDLSNTTFVVWQKQHSAFSSQVFVSRFQNESWSEPVAVLANPFSQKLDLQMHILRSTLQEDLENEAGHERRERLTLHIFWREPRTSNDAIIYVPMIFVDGEAAPGRPSFAIEDLLGPFSGINSAAQTMTTQVKLDRHALTGAFIDDITSQLVSFKLEELPDSIRSLADEAYGYIREFPVGDLNNDDNRRHLAESARAHIHGGGFQLHPAALSFIATGVESLVINSTEDNLLAIADKARHHIVGGGVNVLNLETPPNLDEGWILEVDSGLGLHYIDLQPILRVETPDSWVVTEEDTLLVSQSGSTAALVSVRDTAVQYIVATSEGWSSLFTIPLSENEDSNALIETVQRLLDRQ